jgi:hypothetical protein
MPGSTSTLFNGQMVGMLPSGIVRNTSGYYFVAGIAYLQNTTSGNITWGRIFVNRHYNNGTLEKGHVLTLNISGFSAESYRVQGIVLLTNGDILLYGYGKKGGKDVAFACAVDVSNANSAQWTIRWTNTYEITNKASMFLNHFIDNSSNIVLLGGTDDGGLVVKFPLNTTTAAGAKPTGWPKTIAGTDADFCGGLAVSDGSGYLLIGVEIGPNGGQDIWAVKTDSNATKLWEKNYGGAGTEFADAVIEQQDHFIITGVTLSPVIAGQTKTGTEDIYILKINKDGTMD